MQTPGDADRSPPPDRSGIGRWLVATLAIAVLLVVLGIAFLRTETALVLVVREVERASQGRLAIDSPSGSLLGTVRASRVVWSGPAARVVATDVALDWSPRALVSGRVLIHGLGARTLLYEAAPSSEPARLPDDLALPIEVRIDRVGVGSLEWRLGGHTGTITGLAFGYAGGVREHSVDDLAFVFEQGTISARGTLGASAPFPVRATVSLNGDRSLRNARASAAIEGTLHEMSARAEARAGDAVANATAVIAPSADPPVSSLQFTASGIDLAEFESTWPRTRLEVRVAATPSSGGGANGDLTARNAVAGRWDEAKVPVETLASRFSWTGSRLVLSDLVATLPGDGRIAGNGTLEIREGLDRSSWSLNVRDLDLARIHGSLVATRLAGSIGAEVARDSQTIRADLTERDMALAFDAIVAGPKIDASRVRIRAGAGEFSGRGTLVLDDARPFTVEGAFQRFDPSRFGRFPHGVLTGRIALAGALQPAWRAEGTLSLSAGSELSTVAISGDAQGKVAADRVRDLAATVAIGNGRAKLSGSAGAPGDRMSIAIERIRLADIATLAPQQVPRSLEGIITANGIVAAEAGVPGGRGEIRIDGMRYQDVAIDHVEASFDLATTNGPPILENRTVKARLAARGLSVRDRAFARVDIDADGTLAQHRVEARVQGEGLSVAARAHGSARETRDAQGHATFAWKGTIDALDNGGRWPFRLETPASVAYEGDRLEAGAFTLAIADGRVQVRDFALENGRISTHGAFDAIPASAALRMAGYELPIATDLAFGGDWSLVAAPRLNGTLTLRRQKGDVYISEAEAGRSSTLAFGITALTLEVRATDDAIDARLDFRSTRAGTAIARAEIAAVPGAAPARIPHDAPLVASVTAELPTLRTLQPWIGSAAVLDGRARLEASARGALVDPALRFELVADRLKIDAPQYGLHLTDGRLRAHDVGSDIVLSEFSVQGGDGQFTASGTIASLSRDGAAVEPNARVNWKAERFRLLNRPDMRLVVDGAGSLGIERRKLALRGSVKAVQGHFEYARTTVGKLSDDVVVVGQASPRATETAHGTTPLVLDLDVDLGNALTFSGEGLDARLRGRVHVATNSEGRLVGRGAISAVNGTYYAFGQRLAIDRGRLVFDGPLDNPALDIVALRRNQAVEAGVAVTGTVKVPIVTLVSNPPVPDGEKLSWLVLGRSADTASGADSAALQVATAALLSREGKPLTTQIAQQFGLDDISIGGASGSTAAPAGGSSGTFANQVVVFGKRLSDRLSIAYQQGLTAATNALRLDYALTRALTVRAEAGAVSSIGLYYRRTFE